MQWPFSKYVACGNDFILFDNRLGSFPLSNEQFIRNLCHRQCGIGADGVILLENSTQADFRMRIFNANGSEAEMCGNGIRCLMRFLQAMGFKKQSYQIETMQRVLRVTQKGFDICVDMGLPVDIKWDIPLLDYKGHYLNTGVPHFVLFMSAIETIHLDVLGPQLRFHKQFAPHGVNVNLAQLTPDGKIKVRTYERGVEAETLACGTGATAVALAAARCYGLKSPIGILTGLHEQLTIEFEWQSEQFTYVTLAGPAHCTFQGMTSLPDKAS
jgi:diaminopimelate epimerase